MKLATGKILLGIMALLGQFGVSRVALALEGLPSKASIEISPTETTTTSEGVLCKEGCTCEAGTQTCPVGPICEAPCELIGDVCSCPVPKGKPCPERCDCSGETMTCPTDTPTPVCKAPCKQLGDLCLCPADDSYKCPTDCRCEGDAITCPTKSETPIEVTLTSSRVGAIPAETISIQKVGGILVIKSAGAQAETKGKLAVFDSGLSMETIGGKKEITVSPTKAVSMIDEKAMPASISLVDDSGEPTYIVRAIKRVRLLFILPVSMSVETRVNATSGEVKETKTPWWAFLAF